MSTRFNPVLLRNLHPDLVENYFRSLIDSGLAAKRFVMFHPVTMDDIMRYIYDYYNLTMMVVDKETEYVCGEVTLNMFQGKAAFIHFSVHPDYKSNDFVFGFKEVLNLLCESKELKTLIAWIPETNKVANNFIKKLDFKPQCKVDNTCYVKALDTYVASYQSIYNAE
jgi:L-amino acid N-acyltransferase YncA